MARLGFKLKSVWPQTCAVDPSPPFSLSHRGSGEDGGYSLAKSHLKTLAWTLQCPLGCLQTPWPDGWHFLPAVQSHPSPWPVSAPLHMAEVLAQPPTWHTAHVLCFPSRMPLLYILPTWKALHPPPAHLWKSYPSFKTCVRWWRHVKSSWIQLLSNLNSHSLNLLFSWCIRKQHEGGEWGLRPWWQTRSVEIPFQPLTTFLNLGKLLRLSESLGICEKEIIVYTLGTRTNSHKMAYGPATTFNTSATYPLSGEKMIDSIFSRD